MITHKKIFFTLFAILIVNLLFSQEYNFENCKCRNLRLGDHESDSRLDLYDIGFYKLDLELTNTSNAVSGSVRMDINLSNSYSGELVFDLKSNMTVDSVKVNGNICSYTHSDDIIVIDYSYTLPFNNDYMTSAQIYYHGTPIDGLFHQTKEFESEEFEFTYSLSEPYFAKYWFPCKQVLIDKADSSYFYVTIPENLKAGSNGLLENEYNLGNGKKRMEWKSSYPIAYYLISIAVGDYHDYSFDVEISNFNKTVPIQNYIPDNEEYINHCMWYLDQMPPVLKKLSDLWGLYPHANEKYGHCITPIGGGMEHQTMTTLKNFNFRLIVHELAHSWFGNYVTCSSWQDIWINEGFASYGEYLAEEFIQAPGYALAYLESSQEIVKEYPDGSVYVPFEDLNNVGRVFSGRLSYKKGLCIIHMIRYMINDDDLFFETLRTFLNTYANSTASGEDLKNVLENETGIEFDNFFTEWYYGEGYPLYTLEWSQQCTNLHLALTQTTSSSETPLFTIPMEFEVIYEDSTSFVVRKDVNSNFCTYDVQIYGNVIDVKLNPTSSILAETYSTEIGTANQCAKKFEIFPNPCTNGQVKIITNTNKKYQINIMNYLGKLVFSKTYKDKESYINIDNLSKGVYFINLIEDNSVYTDKLVIN